MSFASSTGSLRRLGELLDPAFLSRLDRLDIASRKILRGGLQGERRSKRRGRSVEFAEHRPYAVGDDIRFIDWNIYARLEKLFLKLFLEEQDLSVHIAFDVSASMQTGEPSKDRAAKKLTAALAYISLVNNNRLSVSAFCDGVVGSLANMRGRSHLPHLADLLLTDWDVGVSDFDTACRQMAAGRVGTGVMIVVSDFLLKEGYSRGLRRLIGDPYDLYVLQILSPQEITPDLTGDLKLLDVEDGDSAEVTINGALLDYYRRMLNSYCSELKDFCTRRGSAYLLTNSADPVEPLVLRSLRHLGLLR